MTIACLICGRRFKFLPVHLIRGHGVSVDSYREQYQIPAGQPLCSADYSAAHAEKIRRMQASGALTYEHLPEATRAAQHSERRPRTADDLAAQSRRIRETAPWQVNQLPPGAKRADGRDADRAREYQREYRRKKKAKGAAPGQCDGAPAAISSMPASSST